MDILASKDGRTIAVEIETGKSDALTNVEKLDGAGVDRIIVVGTSTRVRDLLLGQFRGRPNVEVVDTSEAVRRVDRVDLGSTRACKGRRFARTGDS